MRRTIAAVILALAGLGIAGGVTLAATGGHTPTSAKTQSAKVKPSSARPSTSSTDPCRHPGSQLSNSSSQPAGFGFS